MIRISKSKLRKKFVDTLSIYKSSENNCVVFEEKPKSVICDPRTVGGLMTLKLFCVWYFAES